jgi:hypothetical protein
MMSLQLNLLSPEKKTNLLNLARFLFLKEMLEFLIFTLAILAIMMLCGWYVLAGIFSDVTESALVVNRETPTINQDVRRLNYNTKNLVAAGKEFYPLTPRLLDIINSLPPTIKLNAISINRETNSITINGTAETRDDLLNYQTIIASIPWMNSASSPASQLFQKDNINFDLHATLVNFPPLKSSP